MASSNSRFQSSFQHSLAIAVSLVSLIALGCGSIASQPSTIRNDLAKYASSNLVVTGTIVTMDENLTVLPEGNVVISEGKIEAVLKKGESLTEEAANFPSVSINGFVYPGLINAHNHLAFNVLPSWRVTLVDGEPLRTVYDWREGNGRYAAVNEEYLRRMVRPKRELLELGLAEEIGKWGEVKELVSGTTVTQGSFGFRTSEEAEDHDGFHSHLVRNLDLEEPRIRQISAGIYKDDRNSLNTGLLLDVLDDVEMGRVGAFLVHLSEGVAEESIQELYDLNSFQRGVREECGPLMKSVAVIHGTPYEKSEFHLMSRCDTSLVAAPLSNMLYYGQPPDLALAVDTGVLVSLSTDWSPAGSRNLLEELKVVDYLNRELYGGSLSDVSLVRMVTRNPAEAIGWEGIGGRVAKGYYGDLTVIRSELNDPYRALIEATEKNVALVVVGGEALYGDVEIMQALKAGDHEVIDSGCGFAKALDFTTDRPDVEEGQNTFSHTEDTLARAFRVSRNLRGNSPSPLFTCSDKDHFQTIEESEVLGYFYPKLEGLADFLKEFYEFQ